MFFLLWRSDILRGLAYERGSWWQSVLLVILQIGLLVSIGLFLAPSSVLAGLPREVSQIFVSDVGRTIWLMAPLAFLAFLGRGGETLDLE